MKFFLPKSRKSIGKDQLIDLYKFFLVPQFSIFEFGQMFRVTIRQSYRFTPGPFHLDIKVDFYNTNKEYITNLGQYPVDEE